MFYIQIGTCLYKKSIRAVASDSIACQILNVHTFLTNKWFSTKESFFRAMSSNLVDVIRNSRQC